MNGCWKNSYPESVQHAFEGFNINAMHREIVDLAKTSGYQTILNEKLRGGKQTTPDSFLKKPVKEQSIIGKGSNDLQPGSQTPVIVKDDKVAVDNPLRFSASPSFSD
jgi:hypothetical protein